MRLRTDEFHLDLAQAGAWRSPPAGSKFGFDGRVLRVVWTAAGSQEVTQRYYDFAAKSLVENISAPNSQQTITGYCSELSSDPVTNGGAVASTYPPAVSSSTQPQKPVPALDSPWQSVVNNPGAHLFMQRASGASTSELAKVWVRLDVPGSGSTISLMDFDCRGRRYRVLQTGSFDNVPMAGPYTQEEDDSGWRAIVGVSPPETWACEQK